MVPPDPTPLGLTIRSVRTRAVLVPLNFVLGTSVTAITTVPLLLVDLATEQGPVGRAYHFAYTASGAKAVAAHIAEAVALVAGREVAPVTISKHLARRYALLGVTGTVRMALSVIDIALWDALAQALGQPLARVLGAEPRPIAAYDSRGLGLVPPDRLAEEAAALTAGGLAAIKLRLGHPTLAADLAALEAVRRGVGGGVAIMVDYNQALTTAEAIARGRALQAQGIAWLEEPIRHDDYRGNAEIKRALNVPLQIGENFNGPEAMVAALDADACTYVMPDVGRIGGVTGWIEAAAIAAARGIEMSSHLMPEISVHLLAATPTAHYLEYVDWAGAILEQPLVVADGKVETPARPGLGLEWDDARIARLATP
jgi:mandelate racemase